MVSGCSVLRDGRSVLEEYGQDLDQLGEGDRVGVERTAVGELRLWVNGRDCGVAATGLPARVWAVVDLYGKCTQITVLPPEPGFCPPVPLPTPPLEPSAEQGTSGEEGEDLARAKAEGWGRGDRVEGRYPAVTGQVGCGQGQSQSPSLLTGLAGAVGPGAGTECLFPSPSYLVPSLHGISSTGPAGDVS